jgi:hypothetical protein
VKIVVRAIDVVAERVEVNFEGLISTGGIRDSTLTF